MPVHELAQLRDRVNVFRDRTHAGEVVVQMLSRMAGSEARVLAIPAGGIPVAAVVARALNLPLDVAVVSKITPPWNSEVGYGAVAFDGSVRLHEAMRHGMAVGEAEVRRGIEETLAKVRRRVQRLHGSSELHAVADRSAILVDDGLASGFTMCVAIEAVRKAGATEIVVAVPTGSLRAVEDLAPQAEELYCANIRSGSSFAVADAYEYWTDVEERDAAAILAQFKRG